MKQKIKILVLEDNPDDFFLLKEVLESSEEFDAEILHEVRLEGAIERLRKTDADAAVIDLQLPDSFGLDTFLSFRELFPLIPAVIMTGAKDKDMAFKAVQEGAQDYLYKGEPSPVAIVRTVRYAIERQRLMTELQNALDEIKTLKGIVPICSNCKKIRNDEGYWDHLESFIEKNSDASFSHGICPDCLDQLYGNEQWYIEMKKKKKNMG